MSTAIGVLDNSSERVSLAPVQKASEQLVMPLYRTKPVCYLETSEFYQIRGGFVAEVIQNPLAKFIGQGIMEKVISDLQQVTLKAFCKTQDQVDMYAPEDVIRKNAIFADWLTVVRQNDVIVAFGSQTHAGQDVLYLNSAMVDPQYQSKAAFGVLMQIYVWQKILGQKYAGREKDLRIIMRTRNKDVAAIMHHVLENVQISGDPGRTEDDADFYQSVAKAVDSPYDAQNGIIYGVYPEGLPNGGNCRNEKINTLFALLGARDAYFVAGTANVRSSERIMRKEVERMFKAEFFSEFDLKPLAMQLS